MENVIIEQEFKQIVEAELAKRKWSGRELARQMGVSGTYVSRYLTGRVSPGPDVIEKFFAALDLVPHLSGAPK